MTTPAAGDALAIVNTSGAITSKITRSDLLKGSPLPADTVTTAAIANSAVTPAKRTGGFKIGFISAATLNSTGNKAITGVGFKPKMVRFTVITPADSTNAHFASGSMDEFGNQFLQTTAGQSPSNFTRNGVKTRCLGGIVGASSAFILSASYVSMDTDGFTVNVINASNAWEVAYEAYA